MNKKNNIISFEERKKQQIQNDFLNKSYYVGTITIEYKDELPIEEAHCYIYLEFLNETKACYYLKNIAGALCEERGETEIVLNPEMIVNTITNIDIYEKLSTDSEEIFYYKYDPEKGEEQFFQIIIATVCKI